MPEFDTYVDVDADEFVSACNKRDIKELIEENPSLKSYLSEAMISAYQDGVDLAIQETNLPDTTFPVENPYSISQILDPNFLVNPEEQ